MRDFRGHAAKEEVSLAALRRENSEQHQENISRYDRAQITINEIKESLARKDGGLDIGKLLVVSVIPTLIALAGLMWAVYKVKAG